MGIGRIGGALVVAGAMAVMVVTGMASASAAGAITPAQTAGQAQRVHSVPASPKAQSDCSLGRVCIYAGESHNGKPTNSYYKYGTYKLYEQFDWHYIYNHQTRGAKYKLCVNSDGTNCTSGYGPGTLDWYMTPFNSIVLYP